MIADFVFTGFVWLLQSMFIVGAVGCCIAIPITAYKLFAVLFDRDSEEELQPQNRQSATVEPLQRA